MCKIAASDSAVSFVKATSLHQLPYSLRQGLPPWVNSRPIVFIMIVLRGTHLCGMCIRSTRNTHPSMSFRAVRDVVSGISILFR